MKIKNFTLTIGLIIGCLSFAYAQDPGDIDLNFGNSGSVITGTEGHNIETFQDVAIQDDQKIIAVGMGWDANYTARAEVVRYMSDGSMDSDFGEDGKFVFEHDNEALIYSCVISPEGKIILAGTTTDYDAYRILLLQLNADGTLDTDFGDNGVVVQQLGPDIAHFEDMAFDLALDATGNILICGSSFNAEYLHRPFVARFSASGMLDTTFGEDGLATIPVVQDGNSFDCMTIQPDGKILAAGTYSPQFLWNVLLVVRFNSDGTPDTAFGENGIVKYSQNDVDDEAFSMALTPEGNILLAGFSATTTYEYYGLLVQFTPEGIMDTSFGTDGVVFENEEPYDEMSDIQIQNDGKIIIAGTIGDPPPGAFDMAVWKYDASGTRDPEFGTNGLARNTLDGYYGMIHGAALQADNKIVLVGQARTELNDNDFLIARLDNETATGISEIDIPKAPVLSPNPALASSPIHIQFSEPNAPNAVLEFYELTGKLVQSTPIENPSGSPQLISTTVPSNLCNGMYFVKVSQNGIKSLATKIVIIN